MASSYDIALRLARRPTIAGGFRRMSDKEADSMYADYQKALRAERQQYNQYRNLAKQYGVDPSLVVSGPAPKDIIKVNQPNIFRSQQGKYSLLGPNIFGRAILPAGARRPPQLTDYGRNLQKRDQQIQEVNARNERTRQNNSQVATVRGRSASLGPGTTRNANAISEAIAKGAGLAEGTVATSFAGADDDETQSNLGGGRVGRALRNRLRGFAARERNLGAS